MASTGAERLSDTLQFKNNAITTPHLNPSDRILEAARHLDSAIKQYPQKKRMDKLVAIELLRKILLEGEKKTPHQQRSSIKKKQHCHRPSFGTKLGGRPRPLHGIYPSLVPKPRTLITVT